MLDLGGKREKEQGLLDFNLLAFADIQEQAQQRAIEHKNPLQEEAIAFLVKIGQEQTRFKAEWLLSSSSKIASSRCFSCSRTRHFKWSCCRTVLRKKELRYL